MKPGCGPVWTVYFSPGRPDWRNPRKHRGTEPEQDTETLHPGLRYLWHTGDGRFWFCVPSKDTCC